MSLRALARRVVPDLRGLPRPFWVLFGGTLVNRVGGFALIFLTIYLTEARGLTPAMAGAVFSAYGFGAMAGSWVGGTLSDRIGRRPVLVASLLGGGAAMALLGLVAGLAAIALTAVVTGLLYEMYRPVMSAAIADLIPPEDRTRAYGLIYWAINIGASVAPIAGGQIVAAFGYRTMFVADAVTTALFGLVLWAALAETRPASSPSAPATMRGAAATIVRDRRFGVVCLLTFAYSLVFFQSFAGLPLDVRAHGLSPSVFGGLMAINGVLIVVLQPAAGELIAGRARSPVLAIASLLVAVGFGMNAAVGSVAGYAAAVAIWTLGEILFTPAAMALVADLSPAHARGLYQGAFAITFSVAFAVAPLVGGAAIGQAGARWLWIGCLTTGLAVAAGFGLLVNALAGSN
jgi:MFS family permease